MNNNSVIFCREFCIQGNVSKTMKVLVAKTSENAGSECGLTRWIGKKLFNEQRVKITR